MLPWPSWAPAWTALSALPRSISGCGGWAGGLKKTLAAAEQDRPDVAEKSVEGALGPRGGLDKDARLNAEGFRNLLQLRAEMIGGLSDIRPEKYLDLSYYDRAVAGLPSP